MKTTPPKRSRPPAAAGRPGAVVAGLEPRVFAACTHDNGRTPDDGRAGLFTGGATLH